MEITINIEEWHCEFRECGSWAGRSSCTTELPMIGNNLLAISLPGRTTRNVNALRIAEDKSGALKKQAEYNIHSPFDSLQSRPERGRKINYTPSLWSGKRLKGS